MDDLDQVPSFWVAATPRRSTSSLGRMNMSVLDFELHHPLGLRISRHLTESQLLATVPQAQDTKRDMGTGWVWISLTRFPDGDVVVGISLAFNRGAHECLSLADAHPQYGTGWNDWSEDKERRRGLSIGTWLAKRGFPAGNYPWGEVWAGNDAKGGSGSAGVRYAA